MVAAIVAATYLHDHYREPNELREIHTRIPIILPEKHHDAWLSFEAGKGVLVCLDGGPVAHVGKQ